ncbi:hypothetical protein EUTSA_v10017486mg [Eutrema salsugineum]|uniref:Uncharacterized protein n=1 Tax=Eutrema salsugineum TaxID=72664 RepID=V4LML7_EUTSA|nr:hypothetical protein EUTSA_v10017486mg [Eutrema salsugineum]
MNQYETQPSIQGDGQTGFRGSAIRGSYDIEETLHEMVCICYLNSDQIRSKDNTLNATKEQRKRKQTQFRIMISFDNLDFFLVGFLSL